MPTEPDDRPTKSKVLFVCSQNRLRSPTAEKLYSRASNLEVRSAGIDRDATVAVTADHFEWADVVFVMEKRQRNLIRKRFGDLYDRKRIVCLYIPDEYDFMDPRLVALLSARLAPHIGVPPTTLETGRPVDAQRPSSPADSGPRATERAPVVAAVGDVHGHLQLALCVVARWQKQLALDLDAVLLCGDVGTFTTEDQLDSATRRHAKVNPCELEFLRQWSARPQPPWLDFIFKPEAEGGLGLRCPVVMVHGNHEGFAHLTALAPPSLPRDIVDVHSLPAVDTAGRIRLLPSGWRARTAAGLVIAGVGGIEMGQRQARYHPMAYVDEAAVLHLLDQGRVDVLVTHQGPSAIQGETGSTTLQHLLDAGRARVWFHGHSTPRADPAWSGPGQGTLVVPLGDVAFPGRGPRAGEPGPEGWCMSAIGKNEVTVRKETPGFLREFHRRRWTNAGDGLLVCPPLAAHVPTGFRTM